MTASYDKLCAIEEAFLVSCGWTKLGEDEWEEPEVLVEPDLRVLPFGHALNSELLHGPERGTHTRTRRAAHDTLYSAWETYFVESGWTKAENSWTGDIFWEAPDDGRRRRRAPFTKAVNNQKARDRSIGARWVRRQEQTK